MTNIPNKVPIILNDKLICHCKYSDIKLFSSYSEYIGSILEIEEKSNLCINIRVNPIIIDNFTIAEQRKIVHLSFFGLNKELTNLQIQNCNVYMLTSILLVIDFLCPKNKENFIQNEKIENEIILKIYRNEKFDWVQLLTEINTVLPNLANKIINGHINGLLCIENKDEYAKFFNNIPQVCCQIMFEMQQNLKYYRECKENNEHIIDLAKRQLTKIENNQERDKHYNVIYRDCYYNMTQLSNLLDELE